MRVKKFVARTLPEAMVQVKAELGPDAVILHTTEIKVGGVFGLFGSRMIQVMAALEEKPVADRSAVAAHRQVAVALPTQVLTQVTAPLALPTAGPVLHPGRPLAPAVVASPSPALENVQAEVAGMKEMMGQLISKLEQPAPAAPRPEQPTLPELQAALIRGGVAEEVAAAVVTRVRARLPQGHTSPEAALEAAHALMAKDLGAAKTVTDSGRVVAFVGPTGVGKTTTLAKLAAHLALNQNRRIALITADTYRIAAVEQLRTYSEIIGVPLEVVYDPADVPAAVAAHAQAELILVDTAGRSPRNQAHMNELKAYLDVLEPAETYLVLSMTAGYRDATMIVDHYLPMGFDHFLFTKWDEAYAPGLIYNLAQKYKRPLSYVTTGQNVPDDIEVADPDTIIRAILGV